MNKDKIPEKIKELVITKIESNMPSNLKLSIGSYGDLTKEEIISHVKKGDEIGKQIVRVHMSFLKAVASGELAKKMISVENE
ncbi:hypothetical protein DRJ22_00255 [Candidatus Woesearchaeota archaeon]|nr:MAG: hypothetical protein DRJ22_00255 [Candidatus Woesearchaeota archaeon]